MILSRKKHYIILLIMFFSWVHFVDADVVISKVNLDPIGERFVELHNNSNSPQNLTGWSIKRKSSGGIEYSLVSSSRLEGKTIEGDGDFVVVNESSYTGNLTPDATWAKSYTFSSNNTILLYDQNNKLVDDFSVSGGSSNNDEVNNEEDNINPTEDTSSAVVSSTSSSDSKIFKITTKINSPKTVTVGIPFSLSSLTTSNTGITYATGKFVWNFGDGMTREMGNSEPFDYVYGYEGEYVITLSYFDTIFSKTADATNKITIKVIPSEIFISSVGDSSDPFVEIENKSNYEVLLSDWILTGGLHYFKIPEGMMILPNKKIKLSPKITGFTAEDIRYISIMNPSKDVVAVYPISQVKKYTNKNTSTYAIAQNNVSPQDNNSQKDFSAKNSDIINLNDLEASAGNVSEDIPDSTYALIGLFIVIGVGIASFLIFKKKNTPRDYVEGEIRAEDMTIIE